MENKKQVNGSSFLDHLLAPKDTSSSPSSTSVILGSIFPPPPKVPGKEFGIRGSWDNYPGKFGNSDDTTDKNSSIYHNETVEPSYLSSSIYYGGQENYSPGKKTPGAPQYFKKEGEGDDDPNGNNSSGASRGNWWQGSLYY